MNWFTFAACCPVVVLSTAIQAQELGYADVHIDPKYEATLKANTFLMRAGGVDTLPLTDNSEVLVGVAHVALKSGATQADVRKAKRIAETRASATVGEFLRAEVTSVSTLIRKSTTHSEHSDGELQQRTRRVEKFLSTRIQTSSHFAGKLEPVGHWCSEDARTVYAAVAVVPLK